MINPKLLADLLSGLKLRLRSRNSAHRRQRPRGGNQRSPVAAEVSLLEPRCLLSSNGLGGGLHTQKVALHQSGDVVNFAGYEWDTNYNWSQDSGNYINGQLWSPKNAVVEGGQLHLKLEPTRLDGRWTTTSADVELVAKANGEPFNPGYGTYLVAAQTNGSFNRLANNNGAIFGAFTYENLHGVGKLKSNTISGLPPSLIAVLKPGMLVTATNYLGKPLVPEINNPHSPDRSTTIKEIQGNTVTLSEHAINDPGDYLHTFYFKDTSLTNGHRELDMVEASRFGKQADATNAQFTLQPYYANSLNVHRITLQDKGQITLVMNWKAANQPVTFAEYDGIYNLADKPAKPALDWTTPDKPDGGLNEYIPNSAYQTFHLNLWWSSWQELVPHAEEVTVTNFQYSP
jgi:hypothetical protein